MKCERKTCLACIDRRDIVSNIAYARAYSRMRKYGLSGEAFWALLRKQWYCCAICHLEFDLNEEGAKNHGSEPHVDHDHVTGKVRGLLCSKCNRGIGMFGDDIEKLEGAIEYLKSYEEVEI